jgi:leucyl-tRNA synthetase
MQERYEPAVVERAAQTYWDENKTFEARESTTNEGKFYCLSMFPAHGACAQLHHR